MNDNIYIYKHNGQMFHTGDWVYCKNPINALSDNTPKAIEGKVINAFFDFYVNGHTNTGKQKKVKLSEYKDIIMLASIFDVELQRQEFLRKQPNLD